MFLSCPVFECLYEGTRGPGKTDALLMDFAQHVGLGYGPAWRGILFRKEYKELADVVTKSRKWFPRIFPKARFHESLSSYKWVWPDGEELLFRTAKRLSDYENYHGHEYPWIGWEELCNWADLKLYLKMMSVCRSSHPDVPRKYRATTNPYGPGHNVVKARFIDPAPAGHIITEIFRDKETGQEFKRERVRIHGNIYENKILLKADPQYLANLHAITDPNLKRAWLYGDWDIVAGGAIDDVWRRDIHVIRPFTIPASWYVDRTFDWGSSHPFSVGWWAESDGTPVEFPDGRRKTYPRGTIFRIAEWYGWTGEPNEGIRLTDDAIGKGIRERENQLVLNHPGIKIRSGAADSSIFEADPGKDSIAQGINAGYWGKQSAKDKDIFIEADKSPGSRIRGLQALRRRLKAALAERLEEPGLFVFDTCLNWIRTCPALPRDEKNPEDVNTEAEDHPYDETRYRLLEAKRVARRVKVGMS